MDEMISQLVEWELADTGDDWIRINNDNLAVDIDNVRDDHGLHGGYYAQVMVGGVTIFDADNSNRRGIVQEVITALTASK